MKKEDFVAQYIEEYLEGKDEAARESFRAKPLERQYGTIQTWRRRKITKEAGIKASADNILTSLRHINQQLALNYDLSQKENERIIKELESLLALAQNYEERKRAKKLSELVEMRRQLDLQIRQLEGE